MKKILLYLLFSGFFVLLELRNTLAQTTIYYSYDNAGNRTYRGTIPMPTLKSAKVDSTELALLNQQSDPQAGKKKEVFEDKLGEQKILIYPNPTQGELRVDITGFDLSVESSITIYNPSGKLIAKKGPLSGSDVMNISTYPNGIYIMRVSIGDKMSEWKILKE